MDDSEYIVSEKKVWETCMEARREDGVEKAGYALTRDATEIKTAY